MAPGGAAEARDRMEYEMDQGRLRWGALNQGPSTGALNLGVAE